MFNLGNNETSGDNAMTRSDHQRERDRERESVNNRYKYNQIYLYRERMRDRNRIYLKLDYGEKMIYHKRKGEYLVIGLHRFKSVNLWKKIT